MLLIKAEKPRPGYHTIVNRGSHGLRFLEFGILELGPDSPEFTHTTGASETVLDVYSGRCTIDTDKAGKHHVFTPVGSRKHAFAGLPDMLYLPPGTQYRVTSVNGPLRVGVFTAPSRATTEPRVVMKENATRVTVGKGNWTREVVTSIGSEIPAEKLLVGETVNPPGNWSSSPAHKHDSHSAPNEVPMEEIYYFQIDPPQGYALMRVYTAPEDPIALNEVYVVEHGDTVVIPRGYHPVAAAPGYTVHYTWALAGEERKYGAWTDDPRHAWIKK